MSRNIFQRKTAAQSTQPAQDAPAGFDEWWSGFQAYDAMQPFDATQSSMWQRGWRMANSAQAECETPRQAA